MEIDVMQKLIAIDKEMRDHMAEKHEKKFQLKQAIEKEREKLSKKMWTEAQKKVDETKEKLDQEISVREAETALYLKKETSRLQETFQSNRDRWVKELTERIIHIQADDIN